MCHLSNTMNTLQDIQRFAFPLLLFSFQSCVKIIMNILTTASQNNALDSSPNWSQQETTYLVDYLYDNRNQITQGHFLSETYHDLTFQLNRIHPVPGRSLPAIKAKFCKVSTFQILTHWGLIGISQLQKIVKLIDTYNSYGFGRSNDCSIIAVDDNPEARRLFQTSLDAAAGLVSLIFC